MAWRETVYRRRLRRPFGESDRREIDALYHRKRHELPLPTELHWHPVEPRFTVASRWASVFASFAPDQLVVDAELTLPARMLITPAHRRDAVRLLDNLLDDLGF